MDVEGFAATVTLLHPHDTAVRRVGNRRRAVQAVAENDRVAATRRLLLGRGLQRHDGFEAVVGEVAELNGLQISKSGAYVVAVRAVGQGGGGLADVIVLEDADLADGHRDVMVVALPQQSQAVALAQGP
jgi:hypothetical protein